MANPPSTAAASPLRVALLWNGALQAERLLTQPSAVTLGDTPDALFPLPEGASEASQLTVLSAEGSGYVLQPQPGLGGFVCLGSERKQLAELRGPATLGPSDYGVITLHSVALFFQHVRALDAGPLARRERDPALLACLVLSILLHVALFFFLFVIAASEFAQPDALELDAELVKRFMVVPPPVDEAAQKKRAASEERARDLRERDEAGGKQRDPSESRAGQRDAAREHTELAGAPHDAVAAKVRGLGLLGVLSGGPNQALQSALTTSSLDKVLGGMNSLQTAIGRGSEGLGLHGSAPDGAGTGKGALFGAGELGTSVAGGRGKGGRGGEGAANPSAKPKEAQLSLDDSAAKVHGFLSKEQIERVVRANQAAIKYCFEAEMQHQPKLAGAVHMNWRIDQQGHVISTRVAKSTLGNSRVEGCMARQIKRWIFPKPDGGEVDVTYPFLLRGG